MFTIGTVSCLREVDIGIGDRGTLENCGIALRPHGIEVGTLSLTKLGTDDATGTLRAVGHDVNHDGLADLGPSIETASWKAQPDAILCAWQTGQEGGNSVADILTGKANPSGKLTQTFPISLFDYPASRNFPLYNREVSMRDMYMGIPNNKKDIGYCDYEEGIYIGYRWYDQPGGEVSYPFGYGLSYTTFGYSKPQVKATRDGLTASIVITNTGKVAGKEVVQLYVTAPAGNIDKPVKELKAFAKTRLLQPGESQTLTLDVSNYSLSSFVEAESAWVADKGLYQLLFAASAADIRCTASYKLAAPLRTEVHNVLSPVSAR